MASCLERQGGDGTVHLVVDNLQDVLDGADLADVQGERLLRQLVEDAELTQDWVCGDHLPGGCHGVRAFECSNVQELVGDVTEQR